MLPESGMKLRNFELMPMSLFQRPRHPGERAIALNHRDSFFRKDYSKRISLV
jgi:hypothetical protein